MITKGILGYFWGFRNLMMPVEKRACVCAKDAGIVIEADIDDESDVEYSLCEHC